MFFQRTHVRFAMAIVASTVIMAGGVLLFRVVAKGSDSEEVQVRVLEAPPVGLNDARGLIQDRHVLAVVIKSAITSDGARRAYEYTEDERTNVWDVRAVDVVLLLDGGIERPILSEDSDSVGVTGALVELVLADVGQVNRYRIFTEVFDDRN